MATRIFEKVGDENLSAFREMTPNHGFDGPEKVHNDVKEGGVENEERGEGKKDCATICIVVSRKHDLSGIIFKNPGKFIPNQTEENPF